MPTDRNRIEEWSWGYYLFKEYVSVLFNFYYPIKVVGLENIPKEGAHIFTPNHQNALIDALGLLFTRGWQPVFLARADIFKKPLVSKILTFLKILPIYRIRDGYDNLNKNDAIFRKTQDVLRNGNGLVILPEGNHHGAKMLRQLKKGVARIAFQTQEASDGTIDIMVIPVGLDYRNYFEVGSGLLVRYGTPFRLSNLMTLYETNPARAYNALLKHIERGIKSEMIHIDDQQYIIPIQTLLDVFVVLYMRDQGVQCNHINIFEYQKKFLRNLNEVRSKSSDDYLVLMANTLEYINLKERHGLSQRALPTCSATLLCSVFVRLLIAVASLPLFLYSFINTAIPLSIPYFLSKKFDDKLFHSSIRLVVAAIVFPIVHLVQLIVFATVVGDWALTLTYAISLPVGVWFFFKWKRFAREVFYTIKEKTLRFRNPKVHERLTVLYNSIGERAGQIYRSALSGNGFSDYLSR